MAHHAAARDMIAIWLSYVTITCTKHVFDLNLFRPLVQWHEHHLHNMSLLLCILQREYAALLKDYVGRPSPLYHAERLSEHYRR